MIQNCTNQPRSCPGSVHVHEFHVPTTCNAGHIHLVAGVTAPSPGGLDCHTHYYRGVTTFDNGHVHYYGGITGPAVPIPGGGHAHRFGGVTSFDFRHVHNYRCLTGRGIY